MKYLILFILSFFVLTACGQDQSEVLRDPEAPLAPDEFEVTDENFRQINQPGPRRFSQDGENVDFIEDKKRIKNAAERMPDVEVESVTLNNQDAFVRVRVHAPMNNNDRMDWIENIRTAIERSIPKYNIHVNLQ